VEISRIIQARHFPAFALLDPVFDSPSGATVVSYSRCGDSAAWTGHYLAAEAFRYKVTGSADALANARRALAGIQSLVDVTGNNVLARCLLPDDSPYAQAIQQEEARNGIYRSAPPNFWVGNTSRDQYSGVIFGLGVAWDLIDAADVRSAIAGLVTRLVQFLIDHGWSVILPNGTLTTTFVGRIDQQLAFLQLARRVNPDQFSTRYDVMELLFSRLTVTPIALEVTDNNSYFKFNLDTIKLYTLIHLAGASVPGGYRTAYDVLRKHTDNHGNAFFNMVDRAINGPSDARDAETRMLLDQWLVRPRRDEFIDNRGKYPVCGDNAACNPIPVPDRVRTDFLWQRSPFQLSGGGTGVIETAGVDYILPYWMARYYGVIAGDGPRVASAANGTARVAPDGLASIYGTNLADTTQAAGVQPPPQMLGGLGVQVKDSAGVARPAAVYYVSPGQVNFVIPEGTAAGTATVTLHSQWFEGAPVTAAVAQVAPALFSADGSGKGAAAATAVMVVLAGGRQTPLPVFTCNGSSCSTVPLPLGVDAPVYLSLYGTGIRHGAAVACTIGGMSVPVLSAGAQAQYAGLDQVNVALPLGLRNAGEVDVVVTADGQASNAVRVNVR